MFLRTTLVNFKCKEILLYFLPHKNHILPVFRKKEIYKIFEMIVM